MSRHLSGPFWFLLTRTRAARTAFRCARPDVADTGYLLPEELVAKAREVIDANRKAGRRIAVAESCTGGLVSAALTEIAGSSEVFEVGYVTYSNAAKIAELKV